MSKEVLATILLMAASLVAASATANAASKAQQQADIRKAANDTLQRLYAAEPKAKQAVEQAAGYAVFTNFGMKIFLAGGGTGHGIAVDNATKKETFMKMVEVQAGLGLGIKKFRVIFVFETHKALDSFVNSGWQFGGQATAAAQAGGKGAAAAGAASVSPGVWMYQLTDEGLAVELTGKGTKYYKDKELN